MEQEGFFTGYCRMLDGSRTVMAVKENGQLTETDCLFETCQNYPDCPLAEKIRRFCEE